MWSNNSPVSMHSIIMNMCCRDSKWSFITTTLGWLRLPMICISSLRNSLSLAVNCFLSMTFWAKNSSVCYDLHL